MTPFNDARLEAIARIHDGAAERYPDSSPFRAVHVNDATTIRSAVKEYADLGERLLLQTVEWHIALDNVARFRAALQTALDTRPAGFVVVKLDVTDVQALLARSLTSDSRTQNE